MNHREPPQVPQGTCRAGHFPALLLLAAVQGLMPAAHAGTRFSSSSAEVANPSHGYLAAYGAPPLRFAEIIVPANPVSQPVVVPTSKPVSSATPSVTSAPRSADSPTAASNGHPDAGNGLAPGSTSAEKAPLSILPDEVRPQVRPEDFLPFFQIPGSGHNPDVTLAVPVPPGPPAPPTQAPSSATYLQTDK